MAEYREVHLPRIEEKEKTTEDLQPCPHTPVGYTPGISHAVLGLDASQCCAFFICAIHLSLILHMLSSFICVDRHCLSLKTVQRLFGRLAVFLV
jgi:hypothetical protein